jgi:hypothetical protein
MEVSLNIPLSFILPRRGGGERQAAKPPQGENAKVGRRGLSPFACVSLDPMK